MSAAMNAANLLSPAKATAPGDSAEAYQPLCIVLAAVVAGMLGDRFVWGAVPHAVDAAALLAVAALGAWLFCSRLKAGPRTLLLLVAVAALGAAVLAGALRARGSAADPARGEPSAG